MGGEPTKCWDKGLLRREKDPAWQPSTHLYALGGGGCARATWASCRDDTYAAQ